MAAESGRRFSAGEAETTPARRRRPLPEKSDRWSNLENRFMTPPC